VQPHSSEPDPWKGSFEKSPLKQQGATCEKEREPMARFFTVAAQVTSGVLKTNCKGTKSHCQLSK
jgi:hypothetical protein